MFCVFSKTGVNLGYRNSSRISDAGLILGFMLGVAIIGYILLVILHLIGRIIPRLPLGIESNHCRYYIFIKVPGILQIRIPEPADKVIALLFRSCRFFNGGSIANIFNRFHPSTFVGVKAHSVGITVIVKLEYQAAVWNNGADRYSILVFFVFLKAIVVLSLGSNFFTVGAIMKCCLMLGVAFTDYFLLVVLHLVNWIK